MRGWASRKGDCVGGMADKVLPSHSFDTQDGLYDVAWSELHENQVVSGSGDGSIKLWDITLAVSSLNAGTAHAEHRACLDAFLGRSAGLYTSGSGHIENGFARHGQS